jgi:hypothetical protein
MNLDKNLWSPVKLSLYLGCPFFSFCPYKAILFYHFLLQLQTFSLFPSHPGWMLAPCGRAVTVHSCPKTAVDQGQLEVLTFVLQRTTYLSVAAGKL